MNVAGQRCALAVLVVVLVLTGLTTAAPGRSSAADSPESHRIDLAGVRVVNTAQRATFRFSYRHRFQAPEASTPGYPYWWGATVYFDTNRRAPGPEYAAFLTNQCGSGYSIGRVVRKRNEYDGSHYYAVTDKWLGGCAEAARCVHTATVTYDRHATSLRSISFRKVKGCYTAGRVRVSAEFRTGPFGWTSSDWSGAYDAVDTFPRRSLSTYTGWTATGERRVYQDRSRGFATRAGSQAP